MVLHIENPEVERLAAELAEMTGKSTAEVVRQALLARRQSLLRRRPSESFLRFLEEEVWPQVPAHRLGTPLSKVEREEILGYGSESHLQSP